MKLKLKLKLKKKKKKKKKKKEKKKKKKFQSAKSIEAHICSLRYLVLCPDLTMIFAA